MATLAATTVATTVQQSGLLGVLEDHAQVFHGVCQDLNLHLHRLKTLQVFQK